MGLFDRFGGSREDREAKRVRDLAKKSQEKFGDPAMRTRALEGLRDIGTPAAIAALLQRFSVKVDPSITDTEEREYAFQIITSFGEKAVDPIVDSIRRSDSVAWPVRCLEAIVPEEELIGILTGLLEKLAMEYARDPEKKVVLVNRLASVRDPRIVPAVLPLLDDPSDEVRTATLATLVAQQATAAVGPITSCVVQSEAPRVRAAAAAALADLAAPVEGDRDEIAGKLPPGFSLGKDGIVRRA